MSRPYEDIFFYLDLTKDILKKKDLIKNIRFYIAEKNKINLKGHYGLLFFQQDGDPIFITDKKDSEIIANTIEENWKTRPRTQSYFENGLFYIFSYIAETIRKKSKFNRIIVITDTPSDVAEDYTDALFNLVSKIKSFPTFIDVIRISESDQRFFKDDVKINILASDTKGGVFYIQDKKEFSSLINKLVKSKQLVNLLINESARIKIYKDDYKFYSKLAKEIIPAPKDQPGLKCHFCDEEICPVCIEVNDIPSLCESCRTPFHHCCVTNYAINHNIGIPHIFRCPKCDNLLKIQQDEIVIPEDQKITSAEDYIEIMNTNRVELDKEEFKTESKLKLSTDAITNWNMTKSKNEETKESPSAIRVGGYFGKVFSVKQEGDKIIYQKLPPNSSDISLLSKENKTGHTNRSTDPISHKDFVWKPPKVKSLRLDNNPRQIMETCPECGTDIALNTGRERTCPFCGHKF